MRSEASVRRWVRAVPLGAAVAVVVTAAAVTGDASSTDDPSHATSDVPSPAGVTPGVPDELESAEASEPAVVREGAFVIWARGDLSVGFADAVAALPQVTAVAHVRSATLGLVGSRAADGAPVDVVREGFRIPVEVAAIDPSGYGALLPPGAAREALEALAPGQVLLSGVSARLRGIGVGGQVDLASLPGLEVAGIVADGTVGRSEVVLHSEDAAAAGLDDDGTVFLRHEAARGAETAALRERIEALVPVDVTARIVDVAAGEPRRRAPLVLSMAEVKQRFGEFAYRPRQGVREVDIDPAFPAAHIVTVDVPILGSVTCHEGIIHDLRGALERIVDAGLTGEIDPSSYAGCYYPRLIAVTGDRLSRHSWGIALDINVDLSLPNLGPPPHPDVIAAFEAHGFRWGGDFIHPDNHHFEWVGNAAGE